MRQKQVFVNWLRAVSCILILLCHVVGQSGNAYIRMSGQLFNIGVFLFFIMSGFCFGIQDEIVNPLKWYLKRITKIFIPYLLFLIILSVISVIRGINILTIDWLLLLFGCQGSNVGVIGAEHTWFISAILICYLFTPLIGFIYKRIPRGIMITILLLLPLTFAFCQPAWIYTLFNPLSYYGIAFIIGRNFDKLKYSLSRLLIAIFIAVLSLLLRFVVRYYADGTIFYDRIIVNYTHFFAALAISYIFATVFRNGRSYKLVNFISGISFEIYLYHYMFIVGPISLFGLTSIWIVDSFIVVVCTIIIAVLANITTSPFFKLLKRYDT